MKILVVDIGGTHVKLLATGQHEACRFDSDKGLTPDDLIREIHPRTEGWDYQAVSLGYPGLVTKDGPKAEPANLGPGWVGFDFAAALGKPVKLINDAAMQALGSYERGRMLFLGLGTAVGSALVVQKVLISLELGQLPFRDAILVHYLSHEGLERYGLPQWRQAVAEAARVFKEAFVADYLVLGGGNAHAVDPMPEGTPSRGFLPIPATR
jgi:polyphosphate glucokinase